MPNREFWYSMAEEHGDPYGYARLRLSERADGVAADWELKLAFPGGTYEEGRAAVHDSRRRTLALSYAAGEDGIEAVRNGKRLVGRRWSGTGEETVDVEVEDDALAGMGFVLAADLPFERGAEHVFHDYNEAQGIRAEGRASLTVIGPESRMIGDASLAVWKVVLRRSNGGELPIWIDGERRIVQVDWGGGNFMSIAPGPTTHLFRPGS